MQQMAYFRKCSFPLFLFDSSFWKVEISNVTRRNAARKAFQPRAYKETISLHICFVLSPADSSGNVSRAQAALKLI